MGITKKELRRFSKKQLLTIATDNLIEVRKSLSKNVIVDMIHKNKKVRDTLTAPPKKSGTPAQMKARKAFADRMRKTKKEVKLETPEQKEVSPTPVSKDVKKDVKLGKRLMKSTPQPTASTQPTIKPPPKKQESVKEAKKIEENVPKQKLKQDSKRVESEKGTDKVKLLEDGNKDLVKGKVSSTKVKFGRTTQSRAMKNAQKLKRHLFAQKGTRAPLQNQTQFLREGLGVKVKSRHTRAIEEQVSTLKTTDRLDRLLANRQTADHKQRLNKATDIAVHKEELSFNKDIEDIDNELGIEMSNPLSQIAQLLLNRSKERSGEAVGQTDPVEEEEQKTPDPVALVFTSEVSRLIKQELVEIALEANLIRNKSQGVRMLKAELVELFGNNKDRVEKLVENKLSLRK